MKRLEKSVASSGDLSISSAHALAAQTVLGKLGVDKFSGLSETEAAQRLLRDGANTLEQAAGRGWLNILLGQFSSIIVWLLAFAAIVAWFTDSHLEALAILVVLLLNALIGFAIEWQAGRALNALRRATHTFARIRRGDREQIVDAAQIVSGDIVILTAGDRVPADARLIEAVNLRSDESTLTGESVSVEKSIEAVRTNAPLAERRSMLYLGTTIVAGRAEAVVTATGKRTELGRIGRLIAETKPDQTPLERKLDELGKRLVYIVLGVAAVVMLAGFLRGDEWWLML
jgi:Ca2+-transporting ATPase